MRKFTSFILSLMVASTCLAAGKIQNEGVKSYADIKSSVLTTTANLTSGNACIASIGSTTGLAVGLFIYDSTTPGNITVGTTIVGIPGTCSAGQVQMSANAAGSGTGDTITFGGQKSQLINDTKLYDVVFGDTVDQVITNSLVQKVQIVPQIVDTINSGSGTYNLEYAFIITSGSATVGATYTNNSVTFTVYSTVSSATLVYMSGSGAPSTSGTLTKTGGTGDSTIAFSQFLKPIQLEVTLRGPGGGGGGSSTAAANDGGSGTTPASSSTFGSSLLTAGQGGGGVDGDAAGGSGGSCTINSPAKQIYAFAGQNGSAGSETNVTGTNQRLPGGNGGSNDFSGGGLGGTSGVAGSTALANSGGGGGGGGAPANTNGIRTGSGGGAGCALKVLLSSPSATYAYAIIGGGGGGTPGTSGFGGGSGAAGQAVILSKFQ